MTDPAAATPDLPVLAGTDIRVSWLGVGTWAWGDKSTWGMGGYDSSLTEDTIREAWGCAPPWSTP